MKIKSFGKYIEFDGSKSLLEILKAYKKDDYKKYFCAKINNKIFELQYIIKEDSTVQFLDISEREAMLIYQSTLRYIMSYALYELYPGTRIIYNYSVSRSIFCQPVGINKISLDIVNKIDEKMKEIIDKDIPIEIHDIDPKKAIEIYKKQGYKSKVELLKHSDKKKIKIYKSNNYYNYMDNYLAPSTGFAKDYRLTLYSPGIILQYPRSECGGGIPPFQDELVLSKYLKDQNKWGQITGASYITDFNKIVEKGNLNELINLCETRHNNMLAELGENIERDIENIKLICIAGPSSSGKTTFTNRLRIELLSRNIRPLMISLDNYYRCDGNYPKNEDGTDDYEHLEALDLDLFNKQLDALTNGEGVEIPIFDFKTHKRSWAKAVKLSKNQPIMIEGIHALNETLTKVIPVGNKYQIYIAPQPQLHIDSQSPIALTDIRLIRRLVRDYEGRGADPRRTIDMWDSVRRGEFRWIYPYQENADYVFNSELTYELGALKKLAIEILSTITRDDKEYPTAERLIRILKNIKEIDQKWVPCNSILREFIGGSIFYEK